MHPATGSELILTTPVAIWLFHKHEPLHLRTVTTHSLWICCAADWLAQIKVHLPCTRCKTSYRTSPTSSRQLRMAWKVVLRVWLTFLGAQVDPSTNWPIMHLLHINYYGIMFTPCPINHNWYNSNKDGCSYPEVRNLRFKTWWIGSLHTAWIQEARRRSRGSNIWNSLWSQHDYAVFLSQPGRQASLQLYISHLWHHR